MRFFEKWPVHIFLFIIGFLIFNMVAEFLFLRINGESLIVMHDMRRVENIDIAFIGNSHSRRHIDNTIIEKTLGINSFNLAVGNAGPIASYAMMRELFKHQKPKEIVFVYDPIISYDTVNTKEPVVVEAGLWPFLQDWNTKFIYAMKSSKLDGAYLDRFFPWRSFHPTSITEFYENFCGKINQDTYYDLKVRSFPHYEGKGFCPHYNKNEKNLHTAMNRKIGTLKENDNNMVETILKEMKQLCEKNSCKLFLLTTPQLPQVLLGDMRYSQSYKVAESFCQEYNVPFLEFAYAQEEILPDMTEYFYSNEHLNGDGAKIFSSVLAKVLKEYFAGKDISRYFCTDEEYAKSKNYILNGWYTESIKNGKIIYKADSIYGSKVKPEYQFVAVDKNGGEILLQNYYSTQECIVAVSEMEGKTIHISIRNAENLEQKPVIAIKK